ncbi:hypothetical protein HZ994_09550 [Akkermansiaceae bacterium]|nr:hypothetical protein HZ994_09550 [Akkermansiaceae bacterium]
MSIPEIPEDMIEKAFPGGFTIRDEANALASYAFRNGYIEQLHAGKPSELLEDDSYSRITDSEMKTLMIEASEKLANLLQVRESDPEKYATMIRGYGIMNCSQWDRGKINEEA